MEWQIILALVIAIPIILLPAAFVWHLNIGGLRAATRDVRHLSISGIRAITRKGGLKAEAAKTLLVTVGVRSMRTGLPIVVAVGIYAFLIWFFLGRFGWQAALAIALALPIVLLVPVLVWGVVVSGLYQVVRDRLRRRVTAPRRRAATTAEEPVIR